jgi:hypothetical protein
MTTNLVLFLVFVGLILTLFLNWLLGIWVSMKIRQTRFYVNQQNPLAMRFAIWWDERPAQNWVNVYVIVAIVILLGIWTIVSINSRDKAANAEEVVIYTTQTDGVHEIRTTQGELGKFSVIPGKFESFHIYHGKVGKIQAVAIGLARVCVVRDKGNPICGFSSGVPKIGDEAYLRYAKATNYFENDRGGYYSTASWLITKPEADALVATGKFQIVD